MAKQDWDYDFDRYRKLLAEAVDETKRLELIDIVIKEGARDKLEAQRMSDRLAMTAATVARVLGPLDCVAITPTTAYFRDAAITSEPISPNNAQASRPYCRIASACLGASVAVAIS